MNDVYDELRAIILKVVDKLDVTRDDPGHYDVYTFHDMKNGKKLWFGGVQIKKNYVSYHLMPVYENPDLLKGISPELKKRMQGKSCFNFKTVDKALVKELSALTKKAFTDYKSKGYISS